MNAEITLKLNRLNDYLDRNRQDGVFLWYRSNFAWITGGRDNHIANYLPFGVAGILATRDGQRLCFTNTIEAPRFRQEELAGTGIEVIEFPWQDRAAGQKRARELIGAKRIATDHDELGLGLPILPAEFGEVRWALTPEEMARYREGGRRAAAAMEKACRLIRPGMDEHEIAGLLDLEVHAAGCNPVVTLIAADARLEQYRHPIPTPTVFTRCLMLVSCASFGGLISNLTRLIHVGPVPPELRAKHQAVCDVDARMNHATRPGRTLGEIFTEIEKAYADVGHAGQWKLHHQGGSTGYNGRDVFAVPGSPVRVLENQAFAWNPSITGTKSEDTVLVTGQGLELLTAPSRDWPCLDGRGGAGTLRRADILSI